MVIEALICGFFGSFDRQEWLGLGFHKVTRGPKNCEMYLNNPLNNQGLCLVLNTNNYGESRTGWCHVGLSWQRIKSVKSSAGFAEICATYEVLES